MINFEDYLDNKLEAAECVCSPKGLPHSRYCTKRTFGKDESLESLTKDGIEDALLEYEAFLEEESKNENFWNMLMGSIRSEYEKETKRKWISNSDSVKLWVKKFFKK